jgi:predicted metal-dependent phosphoesterase TrpH
MTDALSADAAHRTDLHVHTTASDGVLSPTEVVRKALAIGLATIAITDHDTVQGIGEGLEAAKGTRLEVIPGVEISADVSRTEVHILGYYIAPDASVLRDRLQVLRAARFVRARRMVAKLARLGLQIEWSRVQQIASGATVGRPHVARAMLEKGYVPSVDRAFNLYIGSRGPAYVERYKVSPSEAIKLILAAGGLPVLAHPLQATQLIPELAKCGLAGLEAYYPGYSSDETRFLLDLGARHGLIATAGSDFHGEDGKAENELGAVWSPPDVIANVRTGYAKMRALASRTQPT